MATSCKPGRSTTPGCSGCAAATSSCACPRRAETLTIVAYRQPITRADIEGIRGVQVADVLRQLMEKGLVRIAGREESLGRPQLFGTTKKFLQMFGLNTLKDLPLAQELNAENPPAGEKKKKAPKHLGDGANADGPHHDH